ncbi:hypothetical protein Y032_0015g2620 [Ancylostoma ceylanicum]|nr:hypothetical protein Y032_0015g2620 [Ancylostoma ceylanicum]
MGFNANEIKIMLDAVLACNIFCFNDKLFEQRRGLAMGNRIAPLLAIIFLDHIERMSLTSGILLYKRYIDDVFVIGCDKTEVEKTLKRLNTFDDNISFTIEEPDDDGFLPFLNTKIRIVDGRTEYLWLVVGVCFERVIGVRSPLHRLAAPSKRRLAAGLLLLLSACAALTCYNHVSQQCFMKLFCHDTQWISMCLDVNTNA